MFVFAHVGITLGAASTVSAVITKWPRLPKRELSDHAQTLPKSKTKDKKESISERIGLKTIQEIMSSLTNEELENLSVSLRNLRDVLLKSIVDDSKSSP